MKSTDRGSVVAETAMVLPTLLLVLTLLMSGLSAVHTKLQCTQLAASIARAIERNETQWPVMAREAWPESKVEVLNTNEWVTVVVSKEVFLGFKVEGKSVAIQRV